MAVRELVLREKTMPAAVEPWRGAVGEALGGLERPGWAASRLNASL